MEIKRICNIYFSPTGTTQKVVTTIGDCLAASFETDRLDYDFTLPEARRDFPLLEETDLPVSEIADDCGFEDPNYFARCFRKHAGCAPSAFRNRGHSRISL